MSEILYKIELVYEEVRRRNSRELDARQAEIYEKIPEIKNIDEDLRSESIATARAKLMGRIGKNEVNTQKSKNSELIERKKKILTQNGYPEDYLDNVYTCAKCKDEGTILNSEGIVEKCDCYKQLLKQYRLANMYEQKLDETFDNFNFDLYPDDKIKGYEDSPRTNIKRIYRSVREAIESFDRKKFSMLFWGRSSRGKTYMSDCIAHELIDKGYEVVMYSSPILFDKICAPVVFDKTEEQDEEAYERVYSCDMLIIDDLGRENTNRFVNKELFNIIEQRLLNRKGVIISTNLTLQELKELYDEAIASRIVNNYERYEFYGPNLRVQN